MIIHNAIEPEEAWGIISHLLSDELLAIGLYSGRLMKRGADGAYVSEDRGRAIYEAQVKLVGISYMLARRLTANGHGDDAGKIQQILDMVSDGDVLDPDVCGAICAKCLELKPKGIGV